ncbi:MAG: hypothetical protein LC127_11975, partial [Chitinophagales bacterium]|nr:hypothetical protein [Chitinophagales bacterium]
INDSGDMYIWGDSVLSMRDTLSGLDRNNMNHEQYPADINGNFTPTKCVGNFKDCKVYTSHSTPCPKFILYPNGMMYNAGFNGVCMSLFSLYPFIPLGLYRAPIGGIPNPYGNT